MSDRLRIGLLQCGHVHPDLVPAFGDYPALFADLLIDQAIDLVTYDVQAGSLPHHPSACDAWLISGSADSVYDPLPWIPPIERFVRSLVETESPVVAVCFGHQLMARALGGRVERSAQGWGVGAHEYELVEPVECLDQPPVGRVRLIASHQDQVTELPDGATVVARTDHCPVAAYTLGPRALAMQPHPEFTAGLSGELTRLRRDRIGRAGTDAALASLDLPLDRDLVATWMARFWLGPSRPG